MNKLLKGAVAGAAGVALLLGGAGTFAYWNSSADISGGTIVAGNLAVAPSTATGANAGTWTNNGNTISLASFRAVPGDVLTYTKTMSIVAQGQNLSANLGLGTNSIVGSSTAAADVALASYLTKSATLAATGTGITSTGTNTFKVVAGSTTAGVTQDVTVSVTITFPRDAALGATAEAATKLGSVSLSNLAITLTQI